jgi:hypothetical protein
MQTPLRENITPGARLIKGPFVFYGGLMIHISFDYDRTFCKEPVNLLTIDRKE